MRFIRKIAKDEVGATMIEYAILASLISVVAITAITAVGVRVNTAFTAVQTALTPGL
jgi:pilus assembly protein Flp/PilA